MGEKLLPSHAQVMKDHADELKKAFSDEFKGVRDDLTGLNEISRYLSLIRESLRTREIKGDGYLDDFDDFSIAANTPILNNDIYLDHAATIRVHFALSEPAVFHYRVNGCNIAANSGDAVVADAGYWFDIPINPGDRLNFVCSAAVTCRLIRLQEIRQ